MVIGIDLRALQTGHKYRGIGVVAKRVTNYILEMGHRDGHEFVFFEYDEPEDPTDLITIPEGLAFSVQKLGRMPEREDVGKLKKINRAVRELYGTPIKPARKVDVFLQYDYVFGVPKNTRTVVVKHDLIPYLFWSKYFESAWVPFKNKALRTTIRTLFANHKYMQLLRRGLKNAGVIVSVSNSTKQDLQKYFKTNPNKIKVAHLGVDIKPAKTNETDDSSVALPTKPYIMFNGAGDARRRVDDLVAAYNNLRSKGYDLQLVLVGENFKSPELIPNPTVRNEVMKSSYKNDILTLGYVSDETLYKLFRGAISYVFPTRYEGFGIPILEAMLLECPVVVYKNSSTYEVGGEHAIYADGWEGIVTAVEEIINQPEGVRKEKIAAAKEYAESFTWDKTAAIIYDELNKG